MRPYQGGAIQKESVASFESRYRRKRIARPREEIKKKRPQKEGVCSLIFEEKHGGL